MCVYSTNVSQKRLRKDRNIWCWNTCPWCRVSWSFRKKISTEAARNLRRLWTRRLDRPSIYNLIMVNEIRRSRGFIYCEREIERYHTLRYVVENILVHHSFQCFCRLEHSVSKSRRLYLRLLFRLLLFR